MLTPIRSTTKSADLAIISPGEALHLTTLERGREFLPADTVV
jgi:hypothetical protein